jgi:hypothetical protein
MGYCMEQREAAFKVKRDNVMPMARALRALEGDFAWVNNRHNARTVEELFSAWRWGILRDDYGDIVGITFEGDKIGDDFAMFQAIAPYVEADSYIEMVGEDGSIWRWSFTDGKCYEQEASIDFTPTDYHGKYIDLRARAQEALAYLQKGDPDMALRALVLALE